MINHFLLKNSPVSKEEDEHPLTQANNSVCITNECTKVSDAAGKEDLKPGRFEQSISVGSPDNLF